MLALIAVVCFVLAFFHVSPDGYDLAVLGLAFLAAHLLFDWRPWVRTRG